MILFIDKLVFKNYIVFFFFVFVHTLKFALFGIIWVHCYFHDSWRTVVVISCFHCGYNSFHLLFPRSFSAVMLKAVLLRPGRFDFLERILGTLSYELYESLYLINKDHTQIQARRLISWHSWKTGQHHTTVCSLIISPSRWLIHFLAGVIPKGVTRLSIKDPVVHCNFNFCL